MMDIILGFMIGVNFMFLAAGCYALATIAKKICIFKQETIGGNFEKFEYIEGVSKLEKKVKELEEINQKMSKYLDTVENRLQILKSERET